MPETPCTKRAIFLDALKIKNPDYVQKETKHSDLFEFSLNPTSTLQDPTQPIIQWSTDEVTTR